MTLAVAPLAPYKCMPASFCPGGPPGSCAANRDPSVEACGECLENTYASSDGTCLPCDGGSAGGVLLVLVVLVGVVALCLMVVLLTSNRVLQRNSTITCMITVGFAVTAVQAMGVFDKLSVTWPEPLSFILSAMSLISFDMEALQLQCTFQPNPLGVYGMRQLALPVSLLLLAVILFLKSKARGTVASYKVELLNTGGSLMQVLFISIVLSCAVPFMCYKHPGDRGYSMLKSPSVICYETSEHQGIMAVGIASFLLVVCPFIALVGFGTARYPHFARESSVNHGEGLVAFRFLFMRFQPSCYYYGSVMIARSLCICLVPVVFRDDSATQILVMATVFQIFGGVQSHSQPWRHRAANVTDSSVSHLMVLMLMCAAISTDSMVAESTLGVLGVLVFAVLALIISSGIVYATYLHLIPRPYFHRFICHHKRDASAQARFLQLSLQQRTNQSCFLDSDNLTDLHDLLDIVRCRLGRLIVFLTSDTLKRPWCAGEITVARQAHQRVTIVKTPAFVAPSPTQLAEISSYLDLDGTQLVETGVPEVLIAEAYAWLLEGKLPCVELDSTLRGRSRFAAVVETVVDPRCVPQAPSITTLKPGMFVFSSDPADDEASAACGILISKLQVEMVGGNSAGFCMLAEMKADSLTDEELATIRKAAAVVVVLTSGSLHSWQQVQVIAAVSDTSVHLIPVNTPSFRFPVDKTYSDVVPSFMTDCRSQLQDTLNSFFFLISVSWETFASNTVLNAQAQQVMRRIGADAGSSGALSMIGSGLRRGSP